MTMKFADMFEVYKETDSSSNPNLTEERIYTFCQDLEKVKEKIPVFSGATKKEGVVGFVPYYYNKLKEIKKVKQFSKKHGLNYYINNEGCITIVADGNAGVMFYRDNFKFPKFAMNISSLAIFKKSKEEIKIKYSEFDGLNLHWFYLRFYSYLKGIVKSEGVQHFTKKVYENIELNIPKLNEQEKELKILEEVHSLYLNLQNLDYKLKKIEEKFIFLEELKSEGEEKLNYFLKHISRNDSLSEEGIYIRNKDLNYNNKIIVLSGSFDKDYGIVPEEKSLHILKNRPCLHVITRGKAGMIRFLKKGSYATNTNAMLLTLRKSKFKELGIDSNMDEEVYLKFLRIYLEPYFKDYCSSADLSVIPLTDVLKILKLKLPKLDKNIRELVEIYEPLLVYSLKLKKSLNKIKLIFDKELVHDLHQENIK